MDLKQEKQSSNHSKTHVGSLKGKEAASVQMNTETLDDSIQDKQAKIYSETFDGSQSSKNSNPEVIDGSGSSIDSERQIDVITRGEGGENNYSDTQINGTKSISASTGSSSSSVSESSSDDFFRVDGLKFTTSDAFAHASKSGKNYVSSSESSAKSDVDNSPPVPTSTYQVYNLNHDQKGMSPTESPPIQVMNRSGGYDSSRIPSSVFERNISPLEWSFASNDSLFSIHLEQNSFSRENAIIIGELGMSEELTTSDELNMLNRTPSIIIEEEVDTARKSVGVENLQTTETSDEDQNELKTSHQAASSKSSKSNGSSLSHESRTSEHSFVPLKKRSRPLCYCCDCGWSTCCHAWPSCKFSCCGWGFCYCWNWSRKKGSDRASPISTAETERNSFVKTDISGQQSDKQESEATSSSSSCCFNCFQSKQASEVTSNSSANCCYWFRCFSCPSCKWKLSCTSCKCCS